MYIEDWDAFVQQAEELCRRRPLETRYCIKYRHKEGKLVLKVTDDVVVSLQSRQRGLGFFVQMERARAPAISKPNNNHHDLNSASSTRRTSRRTSSAWSS